jgi:hypothetical protein
MQRVDANKSGGCFSNRISGVDLVPGRRQLTVVV